ncbi:MAG: hypoxanthine phosphoribosyltransferase [Clostridiales bacterium]|nr:hypoxanthine phosphoribosyltransferase [Clostridiales bacterium]
MREIIRPLISAEEIARRVEEIAGEITRDHDGRAVTLICILKGGVIFMVDLSRKLKIPVEFDFMDISSYGNQVVSSGVIKIDKDLENPITGKHVILVEDIIDTGRTLSHLSKHLSAQKPASLKICALLDKKSRREIDGIIPDYIGFEIPDEFVVGYGLDYAQRYRNLEYIGILEFIEGK